MYFSKDRLGKDSRLMNQYSMLNSQRELFKRQEAIIANAAQGVDGYLTANQAAQIPTDAFKLFDEITLRVLRDDEGSGYMSDLMDLQKTVDIGKTVYKYRQSSDAGVVQRSMSGKVPEVLDKVTYTFEGDPVPIFNTGYGRQWREWKTFQSEGFDALSDDQETSTAAIGQDMAQYLLTGDAKVIVDGTQGKGIQNHSNTNQIDLSGGGFNIDLTSFSTTNDAIIDFFIRDFQGVLNTQLTTSPLKMWISPQIMIRLQRPLSDSGEFKGGTLLQYLLDIGGANRISSIEQTFELSGNEFFAYVKDQRWIRPIVGAAVGTFAQPRVNPMDDYNFMIWGAMGLQIRADFNGRSQVFYATD